MLPLPRDFLVRMARKYNLSEPQEETFVALFSSNQNQEELARSLHIQHGTFRTRMSGVYKKFSFLENVPNKSYALRDFLNRLYLKENPDRIIPDEEALNAMVRELKEEIKPNIQQRCGTMKVLDMTQPIGLDDIYTEVNILETIANRRRLELSEFQHFNIDSENFDRLEFGMIPAQRVSGLDAVKKYAKLMIWGKPGAGKTTFLKYLAIGCTEGNFLNNKLAIFITLREFAENPDKLSLSKYIERQLLEYNIEKSKVLKLLEQHKLLVLLDGLDEVREEHSQNVIQQIQNFSNKYHKSYFVITCRIAAKEYTFQGFSEVEMSDFTEPQIQTFVEKWFLKKDPVKANKFIEKLKGNKPIEELATNPLLLTLLCLVFEEYFDFPQNRSELYEEGVKLMLSKWDSGRNIERDRMYKDLSSTRKQDILSEIAFQTFDRKNYFFKQREIEDCIASYIRNLPDAQLDPEILRCDSESILKAIEAQHGLLVERAKRIYSFSHLTFQEYFTARKIIEESDPKFLEKNLRNLASHISERRWREVFLLAIGLSKKADRLLILMKEQTDQILANDEKAQNFLLWVSKRSRFYKWNDFTPKTMRVFYFYLDCIYQFCIFSSDEERELTKFFDIDIHSLTKEVGAGFDFEIYNLLYSFRPRDWFSHRVDGICDKYFRNDPNKSPHKAVFKAVKQKLVELPNPEQESEKFKAIWRDLHPTLQQIMTQYFDIGYNWGLDNTQVASIRSYYNANLLLKECLKSEFCYISREVREEIEDTLFLPIAEIKKYKEKRRVSNPTPPE